MSADTPLRTLITCVECRHTFELTAEVVCPSCGGGAFTAPDAGGGARHVLLAALTQLTTDLEELISRHVELPRLVRIGVDLAGYIEPHPHGEVQLDATTTPAGLLGWLGAIGATGGQRLADVPVVVAEGRIGDLPVGIIAPLPVGADVLGRQWTVDQLRELIDAPPSGGRP